MTTEKHVYIIAQVTDQNTLIPAAVFSSYEDAYNASLCFVRVIVLAAPMDPKVN